MSLIQNELLLSLMQMGVEYHYKGSDSSLGVSEVVVKQLKYPFLSNFIAGGLHKKVHSFCLTREEPKQYLPLRGESKHMRSLASSSLKIHDLRGLNSYYSDDVDAIEEWKQGAVLNVYQYNPTRIVKVPVDVTLRLKDGGLMGEK